MPPPPPPPPPPLPGMGGPPPPPPPGSFPARPPPAATTNRGALLTDITKGKQLKKAVTNDRSAPVIGKTSGESASSPLAGAPRPPGGLAPPVPANRARSNSDQSSRDSGGASGIEQPPQLAGLFAGGMPKLKKRGGGIDTGANRESSYTSDPESSRNSASKPPTMAAPTPPSGAAPSLPGARPGPQSSATTSAFVPSIANLRKTGLVVDRPVSSASVKGPPPPIGKKPPPPPGSRKPSAPASQMPSPPASAAPRPPPLPQVSAQRPMVSAPAIPVAQAPPPPPSPAPPPPRSQAPPAPQVSLPSTNGGGLSLAVHAAIRAAGQASPALAPPPPPSSNGPSANRSPSTPAAPLASPPPPASRAPSQQALRTMIDPSSYTLSSNGGLPYSSSTTRNANPLGKMVINDPRWKFQDESIFPPTREFRPGPKKYRAGRGSSVPLNLSTFQ